MDRGTKGVLTEEKKPQDNGSETSGGEKGRARAYKPGSKSRGERGGGREKRVGAEEGMKICLKDSVKACRETGKGNTKGPGKKRGEKETRYRTF